MGTLNKKFYRGITFGIEYSYVFKDNPKYESLIEAFTALINYEFKMRGLRVKSHYDGGAVEINSPPFDTLKKAQKFYKTMDEIVGHYPLVARPDPKFLVCGGGGHIHFKPPGDTRYKKAFLYSKLARFLTLHPYIAWMFNEWGDHHTARNFNEMLWNRRTYPFGGFNGMDRDLTLPNKYDTIRTEYCPTDVSHCVGSKSHVLRVDEEYNKPLTFEFRAFDAKESFDDVVDHIDFCNAMIAWVDNQNRIPVSPYNTKSKFLELGKKDKGIEEFQKVVKLLGLPQKRYERFYLNFHARVKYGKLV